jgi:hypothetical protein
MDASQTTNLVDIYNNMVAGSFPHGEGVDAAGTVRMMAREVLHAQDVHSRFTIADGWVFYIACNSRSLASSPKFSTALAAALPGHADHQGDGCYFLPLPPNNAATIVRRGSSFKLFANFSETVLESCAAEDLPRIDVTEASAEQLESQTWVYRQMSNRIASMTSVASLSVIGLCVLIVLGSNATSGYLAKAHEASAAETADKANAIIASTPLVQPLTTQLNRVQSLAYAAVASGGWIDGYNFKRGSGERYVVSLPSWVTEEAVKAVGSGVRTEAQPGANLIWVIKNDDRNVAVKGKGPAPIATVAPPQAGAVAVVAAASAPKEAQ